MMKLRYLALAFGVFCFANIYSVTLRITCRAKGVELQLMKAAIDEWVKATGNQHRVEIIILPHSSNECYAMYLQSLSANSFDVDILQMDTVFIDAFSKYIAPLDQFLSPDKLQTDDYFDAVKNCMLQDGHVVALPIYTDVEIMFYRKDLLEKYGREVPRTWEELYDTVLYIQNEERKSAQRENRKSRFFGLVFQGKAFEMLTCNYVAFLDSFGGKIIGDDGKAAVDSDTSVAAVSFMVKCLKNISSRSVLNYSEEDCRGLFQSGNALFMPNWPYAWALINDPSMGLRGKIGVMTIPAASRAGGKESGTLGGWFFVLSSYSKHKSVAASLIKYLTSKAQQKKRAEFGYAPAFKSLYRDEFVLQHNPYFPTLYKALCNAVPRPSKIFKQNYQRASTEIFNFINTIMADNVDRDSPDSEIKRLLRRLKRKLDKTLLKTTKGNNKSRVGFWDWLMSLFCPTDQKVNAVAEGQGRSVPNSQNANFEMTQKVKN